ncbi:polyisoprenoid-binding protein YceI [Thermocatellispora tengchongensis]|uniref:Polyisoprenoid-binding protein YceI n=1 Tax=Thermocatellispora tengchongensis TaxID=1073253 RepID=A0A840P3K9_9ACTN|nr:YceI family protein [Thermocatellispora tengchongensis]MBB5134268.1 polyisoprenoid-binding protein YceI [Thermocatellispora tengchongensis]
MTSTATTTTLSDLSGDYVLDVAHSRIGFVARHALVTKVRGQFNEFDGGLRINAEDRGKSTAYVTIKVASIDTRNQQRDEHLRSSDFLAMDQFPEITFISTGVHVTSEQTAELTGDLTIRGVTNSVTVPFEFQGGVVDPFGNHRVGFEGSAVINRRDYGITFNAALETGGALVSDKITLEFELAAIKPV